MIGVKAFYSDGTKRNDTNLYNGSGGVIYALHRYRLLIRQEEAEELAAGVDKEDLLTNLFPESRLDEAMATNVYKVTRKDPTGNQR